jgi:CubicO group peptidase (beta-lactamase class C family)
MLASGGAYSTPSDMSRFARMLMNGGAYGGTRILSAAAVTETGKDQTLGSFNPSPSGVARCGLGWDTVTEPALGAAGVSGWSKNGATFQYHASFLVAPKAKLAMTVVSVSPLATPATR